MSWKAVIRWTCLLLYRSFSDFKVYAFSFKKPKIIRGYATVCFLWPTSLSLLHFQVQAGSSWTHMSTHISRESHFCDVRWLRDPTQSGGNPYSHLWFIPQVSQTWANTGCNYLQPVSSISLYRLMDDQALCCRPCSRIGTSIYLVYISPEAHW